MSKKRMYNGIYGLSTGIIVCVIGIFRTFLPYLEINPKLYTFLLLISSMLGSIVAVATIIFRNFSFAETIIHFVSLFFSLVLCFVVGSFLKIWTALLELLIADPPSGSDNLSGLLFVTYFIVIVIVAMFTIIIKGISATIKKITGNR